MTAIQREIRALAEEKNALICAHYYQNMDIQEIADVVGDSFELSQRASSADQQVIVLCGVRFMAESVKILSPAKTVLLPAPDAGCPMADMITPEQVLRLREKHPEAAVVCYVNSSAEVKAVSDVCCTSSSAERIVRALPQKQVIFVPDKNLGSYIASRVPEKEVHLYSGYCPIHHAARVEDVAAARRAHPEAALLVHPECPPDVVAMADGVGSTAYILKTVEEAPSGQSFIIGTETGVVERLRVTAPDKKTWLLKDRFICPNMKKTALRDVKHSIESLEESIELDPGIMDAARVSLKRMVEVR